jgi:hypothetical protein
MGGNVGREEDENEANWSCRSGGCGRCETSLAHGDSDDPVEVNRNFVLVVTLDEVAKSGEAANAESGTSLAQILSKSRSSAMCRIRSMVTATGE